MQKHEVQTRQQTQGGIGTGAGHWTCCLPLMDGWSKGGRVEVGLESANVEEAERVARKFQ